MSEREFMDSFWRKCRLVVKTTQRERVASLLSWTGINRCIEEMPSSQILVNLKGKTFPQLMYRSGQDGRLRPKALQQLAAQGASIVLRRIDRYVPSIATLADAIERRIGHQVWVNCYVTFGSASAFEPHYDTQDVLAVQIYGAKRWRGYGIPIAYPVTEFDPNTEVAFSDPVWEELIEPGDVLYVPRGEAHDAVGEVKPSVHLTFGILAPNGIDLLNWMISQAQINPVFRMDITRGNGKEALRNHGQLFRQQLHDLIDQFSFDAFLNYVDQQRTPRARLNLGFDGAIMPDTWLAPTPRRRIALAFDTKSEPKVIVGGNVIRLSDVAMQALHLLLEEDGMFFTALAQKLATSVKDPGLHDAITQLVANGLVAIEA